MHQQKAIKVNGLADIGVADLVEALSDFPLLRTIESCQGPPMRVWFVYGLEEADWPPLANLVLGYLGPELARQFGDGVDMRIRVTDIGKGRAVLTVQPGLLEPVIQTIRSLALDQPRP